MSRIRGVKQAWRVAEMKTGMQIVTGTTPRWHRTLRRTERRIIRWGAQDLLTRRQGYIAYAIIAVILLLCVVEIG